MHLIVLTAQWGTINSGNIHAKQHLMYSYFLYNNNETNYEQWKEYNKTSWTCLINWDIVAP